MSTVPQKRPPVRHGTCRLQLVINETVYAVSRLKCQVKGGKQWRLKKADGTAYVVTRAHGYIACSCPDSFYRGSRCKHMRAMAAAGLVNGRRYQACKSVAQALGAEGGSR